MTGFGLDHLPYGVFSVDGGPRRVGVRVSRTTVLDLYAATGRPEFDAPSLNAFLALGPRGVAADPRRGAARSPRRATTSSRSTTSSLHLPIEVADYVDFYASLDHATNVGTMFRPDGDALTPNWRHLPIGYHGRAGTVVVSGTPVVRPSGQRKARRRARRRRSARANASTSRPSSASSSARRRGSASRCRSPASPTTSSG